MQKALFQALSGFALAVALSGCAQTTPIVSLAATPAPAPAPAAPAYPVGSLEWAAAGPWREAPERDKWRNPVETLRFFGIKPSDTVIEIWPGGGWYTTVIGPYLRGGNGTFIAAHFDNTTGSEFVTRALNNYNTNYVSKPDIYGKITVAAFGSKSGPLAPAGSADAVLTFRNVHNWMSGGWAEKAFSDFYTVLKPGGVLGIEEHRANSDGPQDPTSQSGYVQEAYVIELAQEAGFELVGKSEINANPADTKDHPFGVWTLPPVKRTAPQGQPANPAFDRSKYDAIGESDRMTLLFRKPVK